MKDRVPKYPGRVRLTPVDGLANVYTMERADEPYEAGTALNKLNLLQDATAALMELPPTATPNQMFAALAALAKGRTQSELLTYTGTGVPTTEQGYAQPGFSVSKTFSFTPKILFCSRYNGHWGGVPMGTDLGISIALWGVTTSFEYGGAVTDARSQMTYDGNTVTWTATNLTSAGSMLNGAGVEYAILAVG